jgi:hypothetical protein
MINNPKSKAITDFIFTWILLFNKTGQSIIE